MKKILIVAGARPNFVKVARFKQVARSYPGLAIELVHTGQHSASVMTDVFFDQFGLRPDHFLRMDDAPPITRMGNMLIQLGALFSDVRPELVMVVGDVDSTLAGALAANRSGIKLAHLESGLRSGDMSMPEEVNRILVDRIADLHFVTEESGRQNLLREGMDPDRIHFTGNTMIDALDEFEDQISSAPILDRLDLGNGGHILVTMHRPATVDRSEGLGTLIEILDRIGEEASVIFPIHPRTRKNIGNFGLSDRIASIRNLKLIDPLDYFSFQKLLATSECVITDSGGIQEETTFRGVPCLTVRANTERPITITEGTNRLLPLESDAIITALDEIRVGRWPKGRIPQLWDGQATERVLEVLSAVI